MNNKDKELKSNLILFAFSTVVVIYFGILLAPCFVSGDLGVTLSNIEKALARPLSLTLCENTGKTIGIFLMIEFVAAAYVFSNIRNRRPGEEHGSAKLQDPKKINKMIADEDYAKNRILTQNLRISITGKPIKLSLNTLVIGGMGAGKSFFTLLPNILQANTSFCITDPSKELLKMTGWFLKHIAGYKVKVLDVDNPENSFKYNFFAYLKNDEDILRMADIIFNSTAPTAKNSSQDPMWENMAKNWLIALVSLLYYRGTRDEQNIETLMWIIEEDIVAEGRDGRRAETWVMKLFDDLELRMPGNLATRSYRAATDGAVVTIQGVKSSLLGRIGKFVLPSIQAMMSRDELELNKMGDEKTALFLVVPSEDKSFNFIISMLYAQLFPILYRRAREEEDNRLPIPMQFFIDEMPNFVMPEEFDTYLTTSRKHSISYMMFIQAIGQMKAMFPDEKWNTVIDTCNTVVYLGGAGKSTNEFISEWIGTETISSEGYNLSRGRNGSMSRNESPTARDLMKANEIDTGLTDRQALAYVKGKGFMIDQKNDPSLHKNFKYVAGQKEGHTFDYSGKENVNTAFMPAKTVSEREQKADILVKLDCINSFKLEEFFHIEVVD